MQTSRRGRFLVFILRLGSIAIVVGGVVVGLVIAAIYLGIAELVSYLWQPSALFIYGFLALVAPFILIAFAFTKSGLLGMDGSGRRIYSIAGFVTAAIAMFVVTSSQFFRNWNLQFGGFSAPENGYWSWILYGLSWPLDAVLANIQQIRLKIHMATDVDTPMPPPRTRRSENTDYLLFMTPRRRIAASGCL